MEWTRPWQALIAWIAVLAMLGNGVTGVLCSVSPDRKASAGPLLGLHVICSVHGDLASGQPAPAPEPVEPCQTCIVVSAATIMAALAVILLLLSAGGEASRPRSRAPAPVRSPRPGALGSRAPPLPA
jgi:hypothetical protein